MGTGLTKVNLQNKNAIEAIKEIMSKHGITVIEGKDMLPFKVNNGFIPITTSMSSRQACEWIATRIGVNK